MLDVFREENSNASSRHEAQGEKEIQSRILSEMIVIDKQRALTSMKAWNKFVQMAAAGVETRPFSTLDEYIPFRIIDAGEM